ncbi:MULTISPECIES: 2OG-Fe(II) oxygenase family protein [unclassified Thiocapsa]|uniref:2OG-Fe(II) oxygenase family protein n=1 Tax=unclassified Thiocapsa TaxID=2641286 RepID=UPI0035AEBF24
MPEARLLPPFSALAARAQLLGVVPGTSDPGGDLGFPILQDDGRLTRAFLGGPALRDSVALVLRPTLAIAARLASPTIMAIDRALDTLLPQVFRVREESAPVLMVPDVLPQSLCARLIAAHDADNFESGMLRQADGAVVLEPDAQAKKRRDHRLTDAALVNAITAALSERLMPAIARAFHYPVTHMEGYKVVAYDAATGGYFRLHRDNVTPDARHRRFALSLNLNADYEGGELIFPEFDACLYRPPAGGALVFSGTHLHAARDVLAGKRYVLLTFMWGDEASAR